MSKRYYQNQHLAKIAPLLPAELAARKKRNDTKITKLLTIAKLLMHEPASTEAKQVKRRITATCYDENKKSAPFSHEIEVDRIVSDGAPHRISFHGTSCCEGVTLRYRGTWDHKSQKGMLFVS